MSFLDRFQSKIATVTAHGHLKKADGSEEIRVGPPKRKPRASTPESSNARANPPAGKQQQHQSKISSNSHNTGAGATTNANAGRSGVNKQGSAAVPPLTMPPGNASKTQQAQLAPSNSTKQPQQQQQQYGSPNASPRHKSGRDANGFDNNHSHRDAYKHHFDADNIPGRLKDDYYDEPQYSSRSSYGQSKSPSPTHDRYQRHDDPRSRFVAPPPEPEQRNRSPRSVVGRDASPQKDMRSPQEINEARVQSDQDQLAFSRKARPVQYEPCKLSQYKKEKPAEYYELGKLQPDLNSEDLVQKRANAERIKAFSKNLRAINKATQPKKSDSNNDSPPAPSGAAKTSASTRLKALEFAKRIPKPKHSSRSDDNSTGLTTVSSSSNIQSIAATSRPINCVLDDDSEDDQVSSELQQLQLRHQASRAQVDALIKKG